MTAPLTAWLNPSSLWQPEFRARSSWIEHAPFAFWLVSVLRPRQIVELGAFHGYSYFVFCQAVAALGLECRCHAVDTWQGDAHAGFYRENVFKSVAVQNEKYARFSDLKRMTFDAACGSFADSSIDLLHIDGLHTYNAVAHDFATWRTKLSDRAVVLFHDTNVRARDFGVFRLWAELRNEFQGFEFTHCNGLGILGYGENLPPEIQAFLALDSDEAAKAEIRATYHRLGATIGENLEALVEENAALRAKLEESRAALQALSGGRIAQALFGLPRAATRIARRTVRRFSSR